MILIVTVETTLDLKERMITTENVRPIIQNVLAQVATTAMVVAAVLTIRTDRHARPIIQRDREGLPIIRRDQTVRLTTLRDRHALLTTLKDRIVRLTIQRDHQDLLTILRDRIVRLTTLKDRHVLPITRRDRIVLHTTRTGLHVHPTTLTEAVDSTVTSIATIMIDRHGMQTNLRETQSLQEDHTIVRTRREVTLTASTTRIHQNLADHASV